MSAIATEKKRANWQHPNHRRGCQSCRHGYEEARGAGFCPPAWRCTRHGWATHRHAICDQWEARK